MAKMKHYAVDVEITIKRTLFVEARRPNGAAEKLLSDEGWAEAFRYDGDTYDLFWNTSAKVVGIREAGF